MKIGILGNMNNNSNNLMQYLRAAGADAHLLFYENEAGYFMPDADEIAVPDYPHKTLTWGSYRTLMNPAIGPQVRADVAPFDILIGTRLAPAYMSRFVGRPLDVFMPTGGDIWTVPHFSGYRPKNLLKWIFVSRLQRKGIRDSRSIFFDKTNPEIEDLISPLFDAERRVEIGVPAIYSPAYRGKAWEQRLAHSSMKTHFQALRSNADVFLVHHVKHLWQPDAVAAFDPYQAKGNDRILVALSQIRDVRPGLRVKVLMCEYGPDVTATKSLAKSLRVDDMIAWIPLSPRREIMVAISLADAVIGELARSWLTYGTIVEAMVQGKPVIHNRDDSFFSPRPLYPMYHATSAEEVREAILQVVDYPGEAVAKGTEAQAWYEKETIAPLIREILCLTPSLRR